MVESLRLRKQERTRKAIITAATELFAERGFDAVTVAQIAARADVAPRTFHRYFPDKAELLFTGDGELREALEEALRLAPVDDLPGYVLTLLDSACRPLAGRHADLVVRERALQQVPVLRARDLSKRFALEAMVAEDLARRLGVPIDQDPRPRGWAGVAFATFAAGYQSWLARGGELSEHLRTTALLLQSEVGSPPTQTTHRSGARSGT